ncbi:MAG: regulatory protein RecX [Pseudomonadota bacterium]
MNGGGGWSGGFRRRTPKPPADPASGAAARGKALSLLSRRDYPSKQLRDRLGEAGFAAGAVEAAVTDLEDQRFVNDERYVETAVAGRTSRGQGPVRITIELVRRGCPKELVAAYVQREHADWIDHAIALRTRRFGAVAPVDARERARQVRFLLQRGFTGTQVRAALGAAGVAEELDLEDEPVDFDADDGTD